MFGLFKRTKVDYWEIELLRNVILQLPSEYGVLLNQINDGLIKGVLIGSSDISGYIAFTYNSEVLRKYDRESEIDYKLTNILVHDSLSSSFLELVIYVSTGTISGYSLTDVKKHKIDFNQIDTSKFRKEYIGVSEDYARIKNLLTKVEQDLVNPSEIYSIFLNGKEYFHIKDIEDGNFIGMNLDGQLYKISHHPIEINLLDRNSLKSYYNISHRADS